MTIDEKEARLDEICDENPFCTTCPIAESNGRCPLTIYPEGDRNAVIEATYRRVFPETDNEKPRILDSGERRQFYDADGNPMAVRDIQEGKGRCDLMPLDVVNMYMGSWDGTEIFNTLNTFQRTGNPDDLFGALWHFNEFDPITTVLEVAKHFEAGAKKYGEYNWQKGIPVKCYIDYAVRHYLKWLRGDEDEPHDRAFVWNIMCCIWTCIHKPELNDYRKDKGND